MSSTDARPALTAGPGTRLHRSRERYGRLLEELRAAIVTGALDAGAPLPSEHDLRSRFGLSRNSVRRAVAELAAEGLVRTYAGRGSYVTAPADPGTRVQTLRLAVYYPSAQTAKLGGVVRAFEEAHPLIRIQPLRLHPQGYGEAVTGLIESGQGPDLVVFMNGMLPDLDPATHFLDLGEFLAEHPTIAGDLYPLAQRLFRHEGRQFGLPFVFSPIVMAHDRRALDTAGVPEPDGTWTWNDLLDAARRLTVRTADGRVERYGFHLQMALTRWPAMVLANGGGLATPEGERSLLDVPASVDAVEFLIDLAHRHGVSGPFSSDLHGEALFVLGRAPMALVSHYAVDLHQFASSGIEWDLSLVPAGAGGAGVARRHLFQGTGVAVHKDTPHRSGALAFLEFLLARATQERLLATGCSLPVRPSVAEDARRYDPRIHPRRLPIYLEAMAENGDRPVFYSTAAAQAAHQELLMAFAGIEPAAAACRRAAAAVEAHLRGRVPVSGY